MKDGVIALYSSVGWEAYTKDPDELIRAIKNSTYMLICKIETDVVGLIRSVSDDMSINYIQDILVHRDFQRRGIGKILMSKCLERFSHVVNNSLLTDAEEKQIKFYQSFGFRNPKDLKKFQLNSFIKMKHLETKEDEASSYIHSGAHMRS